MTSTPTREVRDADADDRSVTAGTTELETVPRRSRGRRRLRLAGAAVGLVLGALLAFALFLLLKPVDLPPSATAPRPAASFTEAMARFDDVASREQAADLIPACRSKLLTHGEKTARSIVLLHGYTNCPQMFVRLGEQLEAEGFNVYIPLAPEHGEIDREHSTLANLTTAELIAYGNEAVDIARGLGDEVTVLGLSGGGAVTSYLAQYRDDVQLAIPVAPYLGLPWAPDWLTPALVNLTDLVPPIGIGTTASAAASSGTYAPYASFDNNTRSAAAYMRLGQMVLADAAAHRHRAERTVTVLNEGDDTVNNAMGGELTRRWVALAPEATSDYRFAATLKLPHDLIGPDRVDQRTAEVYPVLLRLVGRP